MFGSPSGTSGKDPTSQWRRHKRLRVWSLGQEGPWSRKWQPTPVFWPVNPMDRGAWWATGHRVTKSQTRLKRLSTGVCLPVQEHIVTIHGRIFMCLLEYCVCMCTVTPSCLTLCNPLICRLPGSLSMEFSDKNTRASCHFLLQGIFLIQGSNPHLLCFLCWQVDSLPLNHLERLLTVWVLSTPPLQCGSKRKIILSWTVKSLSSYPTSKLKCKPKYWQKM